MSGESAPCTFTSWGSAAHSWEGSRKALADGHRVTGCDANVYPPMSELLRSAGIELIDGYDAAQTGLAPDLYVIGNVVTRGNPLMETILESGAPFASGPQWVGENLLRGRWVLAS